MKTTVIPPSDSNCATALKSEVVLPNAARAPAFSDNGPRLSSSARKLFRAVRVFLSSIADSSAFQEISANRQVVIIFTSNGPLIYRWEPNKDVRKEPDRSPRD